MVEINKNWTNSVAYHVVYGGGTVGLMGEIAKTIVSIAGPDGAHGIIPEALVKWERDATYSTKKDANGYHVPEELGKQLGTFPSSHFYDEAFLETLSPLTLL